MYPSEFTYLNLPLKDEPASEEQLHLPLTPLAKFIPSAAFFIQDCLDNGGRVMVHCRKGISRSVSIVAGYLMYERGANLVEALTLIRRRRKVADPNVWFVEDLKLYQMKLELDRFNRFRAAGTSSARPATDIAHRKHHDENVAVVNTATATAAAAAKTTLPVAQSPRVDAA
ncbi:Dual specificity protein phosphatase [Hondaea fermentalgiana]|uniref:Dual specificity protein phosphatase n=1 Tax=Hondaea fermentalgiana TaxID=2315210 RepID=A0A2R5GVV9_9STRA|nr:Dual specificity protein phosphatase [Hondaea fermentalgiana]|eukprot:GBG32054.1 Dual specificity protein phosphatase [Hondaea fermentalgiana]